MASGPTLLGIIRIAATVGHHVLDDVLLVLLVGLPQPRHEHIDQRAGAVEQVMGSVRAQRRDELVDQRLLFRVSLGLAAVDLLEPGVDHHQSRAHIAGGSVLGTVAR
ncbi:hypothetical protein GCM10010278_64220 [Streptomyces melanogenes]|nr:hypothetical protein GCM10010278_64220 [Streptomyces melanogenes]